MEGDHNSICPNEKYWWQKLEQFVEDLIKAEELKIYSGIISLPHQRMDLVCFTYKCIFTSTTSDT